MVESNAHYQRCFVDFNEVDPQLFFILRRLLIQPLAIRLRRRMKAHRWGNLQILFKNKRLYKRPILEKIAALEIQVVSIVFEFNYNPNFLLSLALLHHQMEWV